MANSSFEITAIWDEDALVWVAESNIEGLHIEAETLEEFETEARKFAAELIVENHYRDRDIDFSNLKDWIPTINWRVSPDPI